VEIGIPLGAGWDGSVAAFAPTYEAPAILHVDFKDIAIDGPIPALP
jgi:hypothetical protein